MDVIQGRRRYGVSVLKDPTGLFTTARLVGALGQVAEPGEVKAICLYKPETDVGKCLQTGHGCGHNISKRADPHNGSGPFIVEVIGWGKFLEGEWGWRTEYMEIVAISCPKGVDSDIVRSLKSFYNVPVTEREF